MFRFFACFHELFAYYYLYYYNVTGGWSCGPHPSLPSPTPGIYTRGKRDPVFRVYTDQVGDGQILINLKLFFCEKTSK